MRRVLLLFLLSGLTFNLAAAKTDYWVLGSFNVYGNAETQKQYLDDLLGIEIILMPIDELRVTRLVLEKKYLSKESLDSHGISAWTIKLDDGFPPAPAEVRPPEDVATVFESNPDLYVQLRSGYQTLGVTASSVPDDSADDDAVSDDNVSKDIEVIAGSESPAESALVAIEVDESKEIAGLAELGGIEEVKDVEENIKPLQPVYSGEVSEVLLEPPAGYPEKAATRQPEPIATTSLELRPGETVPDYCVRVAADDYYPAFCSARRLLAVKTKTSKLSRHGLELRSFCQQERLGVSMRELCRGWQTAGE